MHLRLMSYNIQVGIGTTRYRHYLTHSWKHVLPHANRYDILSRIGQLASQFDVVALQESDAGSLRSHFINQTAYLAEQGRFPFWYEQINRNFGKLARHSLGLLSRFRPHDIERYRLPGLLPGRGAILARFGEGRDSLVVLVVHLALGSRTRMQQLQYISEILSDYRYAVVMGDFNCVPDSREMRQLQSRSNLVDANEALHTFPSWKPDRKIDHILVSAALKVDNCRVLQYELSDHLPLALDIEIPADIQIHKGF